MPLVVVLGWEAELTNRAPLDKHFKLIFSDNLPYAYLIRLGDSEVNVVPLVVILHVYI